MLCLLALTNGNCLYSYNVCVCGCLYIIASSATYGYLASYRTSKTSMYVPSNFMNDYSDCLPLVHH